jgi:hypothetical protein
MWLGRDIVKFRRGGIWNLDCNVHIIMAGESMIFAKLVKREGRFYIWLQSDTSAAKPYTIIIHCYKAVFQQRCRVQPVDFTEEEVIRSKDALGFGEAEFAHMAYTLDEDDSKVLEIYFDFRDHDCDDCEEEFFHLIHMTQRGDEIEFDSEDDFKDALEEAEKVEEGPRSKIEKEEWTVVGPNSKQRKRLVSREERRKVILQKRLPNITVHNRYGSNVK